MKLEELHDELAQDLVIDPTKLQNEAATNPIKFSKWATKRSLVRKELLRLDAQKKKIQKQKLDYYSGRGDEVSLDRYERSEMKTVLSGDSELLKIDTSIEYYKVLLEFCSDAMDALKSRGFSIKHIIELRQFEEGQ